MRKLHGIALATVVIVWLISATWNRGEPIVDLPILFAFFFGFVLGIVYGNEPESNRRPVNTFWLVTSGLFGLFLGAVVGIIQWIAYGEWLTSAFLTDCAFGLAFGLLLGLTPRASRDRAAPDANR
jgi:FtsH-binding integral membrane protein